MRNDAELLTIMFNGAGVRVQTLNLHHLELAKREPAFRASIESATWVTADGWPVRRAFNALGYRTERVTGYDFVSNLLNDGRTRSKALGLLGASPNVATRFKHLTDDLGIQLVYSDQRRREEWNVRSIVDELNRASVDILMVAVTPPWGDLIANEIFESGFQGNVIAVGGAIDIATGQQSKGPDFVGKFGLVWLYRMIREPKRLFARYIFRCLPVMILDVIPIEIGAKIKRRGKAVQVRVTAHTADKELA
ncbi:MAG: WecB/TagA/CpsF family glycosyltransferase [Chloroflexia bacterium]|nr:WecB/TagA/CpsF family glycosyltransferase [Chloroflexia bacterium]